MVILSVVQKVVSNSYSGIETYTLQFDSLTAQLAFQKKLLLLLHVPRNVYFFNYFFKFQLDSCISNSYKSKNHL